MKKFLENIGIVFCCFAIFCFMLTGTFVFARDNKGVENKSYYVENVTKADNYKEESIALSNKLSKKVETSKNSYEYEFEVVNGNVVLTNLNSGLKEAVYTKGDAKGLAQVNYYYYDAAYVLIVTENGDLYANIYSNNKNQVKFRKIKTNNKIESFKVVEKTQKFYEYPQVELYGLDKNGDLESIKL